MLLLVCIYSSKYRSVITSACVLVRRINYLLVADSIDLSVSFCRYKDELERLADATRVTELQRATSSVDFSRLVAQVHCITTR